MTTWTKTAAIAVAAALATPEVNRESCRLLNWTQSKKRGEEEEGRVRSFLCCVTYKLQSAEYSRDFYSSLFQLQSESLTRALLLKWF